MPIVQFPKLEFRQQNGKYEQERWSPHSTPVLITDTIPLSSTGIKVLIALCLPEIISPPPPEPRVNAHAARASNATPTSHPPDPSHVAVGKVWRGEEGVGREVGSGEKIGR